MPDTLAPTVPPSFEGERAPQPKPAEAPEPAPTQPSAPDLKPEKVSAAKADSPAVKAMKERPRNERGQFISKAAAEQIARDKANLQELKAETAPASADGKAPHRSLSEIIEDSFKRDQNRTTELLAGINPADRQRTKDLAATLTTKIVQEKISKSKIDLTNPEAVQAAFGVTLTAEQLQDPAVLEAAVAQTLEPEAVLETLSTARTLLTANPDTAAQVQAAVQAAKEAGQDLSESEALLKVLKEQGVDWLELLNNLGEFSAFMGDIVDSVDVPGLLALIFDSHSHGGYGSSMHFGEHGTSHERDEEQENLLEEILEEEQSRQTFWAALLYEESEHDTFDMANVDDLEVRLQRYSRGFSPNASEETVREAKERWVLATEHALAAIGKRLPAELHAPEHVKIGSQMIRLLEEDLQRRPKKAAEDV